MGESVIDEFHCERSEPTPDSKTSRLHILERCTELVCADDEKVEGKCGHFSIRGYVAEIRKIDWKISWPFSLHDERNKFDEHTHWLPPMNVSEFRWWRCPNCLKKAGADTDGEVVHCSCDVKDDGKKLLSGFQQVSQENFSEGRKGGEDATANLIDDIECYPSLYSGAKEKEASVFYSSKDGISDHIVQSCHELVSHSPRKEAKVLDSSLSLKTNRHVQNLSLLEKPIFHDNSSSGAVTFKWKGNAMQDKQCSTKDEAHNAGSNIEFMSNNASKICHMDNVGFSRRNLVNMKEKHDKVTADHGISPEVDKSVKNDDPLNVVTGPTSELDSVGLYESENDISENNEDLAGSEAHNQRIAVQFGTSSGTLHQNKARKMRLLTDIIENELPGASKKNLVSNRDTKKKSVHTEASHSKAKCDASKDLDLHSGLKSSLVVHKDDKKNIVHKKCSKTLLVEDKGSSLMSWLKDVAGKIKIPKRYGESKRTEHVASEAVNSKSSPDVSNGIGMLLCQSDVAQKSGKKGIVLKKQNKRTHFEDEQSFLTHCREPISGKSKVNAGNAESKYIVSKAVQSTSPESALPVLGARQGPNYRKTTLSKKNKMPQVENGTSTPMHWRKDALATSKGDSVTELQGHKKASKKHERKSSKTCEYDSSDDIPMEIVELMAKNQHERLLSRAEDTTENMYKMPETIAGMKVPNIVDFTDVGKEVPGFLQEKNSSVQQPQSSNARSGVCTTGKQVEKAGKKPNGNTCICVKDNNSLWSTKRLEQSYASTGFVAFSHCQENPSSGVQFPVTVSGINPNACHQNRTVPPWSSCGQSYDGLQIPSNKIPFNIDIPPKVDDLCLQGAVFHCPHPSPKKNKSGNNHGNRGVNSIQKQKGKVISETNKGSLPAYACSSMDQGNACLSMMVPLDLYTNEAISAMNLLRLMDQGACSGTPADISMVGKQANPMQKPEFSHNHQHKEFFGLENGEFRTRNSSMCPMPTEFSDQNHQRGSSCKVSPMFRIGELRCSSQEAASDSSKPRRHFGFINGLSNTAASPKTHRKGKAKSSHLSIQTGGTSSLGSIAQEENVVNAKKRLLSTSDSLAQSLNGEMTRSVKNCRMTEICTINRNPAEFTIPGEGNKYMVGSEDLKLANMFTSSDKLRPATNVDGHKRRRIMKLTAIQGR